MRSSVYEVFRNSFMLGGIAIGATLALATLVTYGAGGTKSAYPHLFYVPIVLAASLRGVTGGVIVGAVAGLLVGPWMPNDVELGVAQTFENWFVRSLLFAGVGTLLGLLFGDLRDRIEALREVNEQTITAFVQAVDAKDPHTAEHSVNVAEYAQAIALELGLGPEDVSRIYSAALLHDIGKIAVPDSILNKPDRLNSEEWTIIKRHPVESVKIIGGIGPFKSYVPGVRHHHERIDGRGYPDGLSGDTVPLDARIIGVADAFEAMTSDRAYRSALTVAEAVEELRLGSGTQFDQDVVHALIKVLVKSPAPLP